MSVYDHMAWAKRQRTGSVGRKAVLMALAERTGEDPVAWPSQQLLADETEQGVRTVRRALADLEEAGLIKATRRYVDQSGEPLPRGKACNTYRLLVSEQAANLASGPEADQAAKQAPTKRPNQPDQAAKPTRPSGHLVASEEPVEHPSLNLQGTAPPSEAGCAVGREIATEVWDARKARGEPVPAQPFIAVAKLGDKLLAAGHQREAIVAAMLSVPTISTGWLETELRKRRPSSSGARQRIAEHAGPAGRVVDL